MSDKVKKLQDFKDEVAVDEYACSNFDQMLRVCDGDDVFDAIDEAAERYAAYSRKQGFDQGVDVATDILVVEFGLDEDEARNMLIDAKQSFKP